jgi:hypothetical protein
MNANELADKLEDDYWDSRANKVMLESAKMLIQQQSEIENLKRLTKEPTKLLVVDDVLRQAGYVKAKTLTDEEINQLWAESHEDGIAIQQGFTTQQHYFARAILRKAQEK